MGITESGTGRKEGANEGMNNNGINEKAISHPETRKEGRKEAAGGGRRTSGAGL